MEREKDDVDAKNSSRWATAWLRLNQPHFAMRLRGLSLDPRSTVGDLVVHSNAASHAALHWLLMTTMNNTKRLVISTAR